MTSAPELSIVSLAHLVPSGDFKILPWPGDPKDVPILDFAPVLWRHRPYAYAGVRRCAVDSEDAAEDEAVALADHGAMADSGGAVTSGAPMAHERAFFEILCALGRCEKIGDSQQPVERSARKQSPAVGLQLAVLRGIVTVTDFFTPSSR